MGAGSSGMGAAMAGSSLLIVVAATGNVHKFDEMSEILKGHIRLVPRPNHVGEVLEDADDLVGNARLKAKAIVAATGQAALADDTGLFVESLDGAPGVHSARYAGPTADDEANRAKLLCSLAGLCAAERRARFHTVMVLVRPDGSEVVAEGVCEGVICQHESGDAGFGYDSIFAPTEADGRTFAELAVEEKNAISHRRRACIDLVAALGL